MLSGLRQMAMVLEVVVVDVVALWAELARRCRRRGRAVVVTVVVVVALFVAPSVMCVLCVLHPNCRGRSSRLSARRDFAARKAQSGRPPQFAG